MESFSLLTEILMEVRLVELPFIILRTTKTMMYHCVLQPLLKVPDSGNALADKQSVN